MPARRSRLGGMITVAAASVSFLAVPALGAAARPAGAVPRLVAAVDFSAIHAEQIQIVTRDYQMGVDKAASALNGTTGTLNASQTSLANDTAVAASAATRSAAATSALSTSSARHATSVADRNAAAAVLATDRERLAQVAVALYIGPPPQVPNVDADVNGAQASANASVYLDTSRREVTDLVSGDTAHEASATRQERRLAAVVTSDRTAVASATTADRRSQATVLADRITLNGDQKAEATAQQGLATAQKAQTTALAAVGTPAADGSPTIIGIPVLESAQLTGWFNTSFYHDLTTASVAQLTAWYVGEGTAEDVRGDVAFAQAIVETGGFASPDAVPLNNYAGIGHCDSCGAGLAFPSPQGGVQGQIQVLRVFASPAGTPLTQPAIIPAVAPGGPFGGGCCPSWQSLTGHYATDPNYGQTVLTIYKSMLDYALSQPPVTPPPTTTVPTPPRPPAAKKPGTR
ncbi:MAG: glucosaminidase domain-containing protein [Actinomycetota bacterium]|nr:glucosaminidase domain-containing protein [Actinomycetota bacterium]